MPLVPTPARFKYPPRPLTVTTVNSIQTRQVKLEDGEQVVADKVRMIVREGK
jgi:hypothetical protein